MLALIGKTCSGKDTMKKELIKRGMQQVVTYTTRPKRNGEIEDVTYHFITQNEFLKKESEGFFAETTSYNVTDNDIWYYGTAKEDLSDAKVIIINPYGLKQLKKIPELNITSVYLTSNDDVIWNRLRQRGDDSAEARRRINADVIDFIGIENEVDFVFRNENIKPDVLADMIFYVYKKTREG